MSKPTWEGVKGVQKKSKVKLFFLVGASLIDPTTVEVGENTKRSFDFRPIMILYQ